MSRPDPAAGFTLLEVLVVLTIGAALLLAAPRLAPGGGQSLRAAAATVAAELRAARIEALTTGRDARVVFDLPARALRRDGAPAQPLPADVAVSVLSAAEVAGRAGPGDAGPGNADPAPAIAFYAAGGASGGAVDLSRGGDAARVTVAWLTGAVDVR